MGREEVQERLIARMRGIVEQTKMAYRDAKADFELAKDLPLQNPDSGMQCARLCIEKTKS